MKGMSGESKSDSYAAKIARGDAHMSDRRYSQAASLYEQAFRMNPDDPGPLVKKIGAMQCYAEPDSTAEEADRLVGLFPGNAESYEIRGGIRASSNRHQDAVDDFVDALELDPDSPEAHKGMGYSPIALGRHRDAVKAYGRAVRLRPDDSDAVYYLCSELEELGRYRKALAVLKAYLPLDDGHNYHVYRHIGRVLGLLGNLEGSFSYYVKSVRLNKPKDGSNEGMFKRYREITGIRRRIKALSPSNPISFYVAGEILLDVNWDETAMDMIGTGVRFRPEPVIHQIIGDLYTKRTRCAEAIDEYKLALELRGGVSAENLPALYNNLIACLFACGRFNEVLEYGKKAISLNVTESHMMERYSAVLGMGPEPVDNDQVACGWTTKQI